jgi:hypothetical protein
MSQVSESEKKRMKASAMADHVFGFLSRIEELRDMVKTVVANHTDNPTRDCAAFHERINELALGHLVGKAMKDV